MRRRLAVAVALIAAIGCTKKGDAPPVAQATMADSAEQVLFNVRTLLTNGGVQRGELFADTMYVFDGNSRFELRRVRASFNTATGVRDGVLSADRGTYNLAQQTLEGFGNVVIVTNDGKRLTSPQLKYMQGLNEVSSDTNFTFVRPGNTMSGVGFRSDPQLTHFSIKKGMKASGSFSLPGQ
ncbi:MAG: LPS export ABC transporter periplasmic protein LptC [Gemmatimonadota bacterium]